MTNPKESNVVIGDCSIRHFDRVPDSFFVLAIGDGGEQFNLDYKQSVSKGEIIIFLAKQWPFLANLLITQE